MLDVKQQSLCATSTKEEMSMSTKRRLVIRRVVRTKPIRSLILRTKVHFSRANNTRCLWSKSSICGSNGWKWGLKRQGCSRRARRWYECQLGLHCIQVQQPRDSLNKGNVTGSRLARHVTLEKFFCYVVSLSDLISWLNLDGVVLSALIGSDLMLDDIRWKPFALVSFHSLECIQAFSPSSLPHLLSFSTVHT